ncbi:hypothetical protein ACLB1Q_29660 [Escherichia coli]
MMKIDKSRTCRVKLVAAASRRLGTSGPLFPPPAGASPDALAAAARAKRQQEDVFHPGLQR